MLAPTRTLIVSRLNGWSSSVIKRCATAAAYVGVRIEDEHRKFVATDAHQNVRLPKASDEARPKLPEQFVAGGMSEGIVDLLEVIEVDVEQRQVPVDRFRVREVGEERVEQVEQLASVAQARSSRR